MRTRIQLVEHATFSYTSEVKGPNNLVSVNSKLPSDAIGQTIEESFTTTAACIGLKIRPEVIVLKLSRISCRHCDF